MHNVSFVKKPSYEDHVQSNSEARTYAQELANKMSLKSH